MGETHEYLFTVKGGFDVDASLIPEVAANGEIVGFKLPDGRSIKLVVGLEIEQDDEYTCTTNENDMEALGLSCLDYAETSFEPTNSEIDE